MTSYAAYLVDDVRRAEQRAMSETGVDLMRRAATGLALAICDVATRESSIALLIGSGNNGGDALWAGALLARRGMRVEIVPCADRMHEPGLAAARAAGARVTSDPIATVSHADVVVDGIVGIGGRGPLRPPVRQLLAHISGVVIAVDIPSGVDADTGWVPDPASAIMADLTVTFGCLKPGLVVDPGRRHAGEVALVDIGLEPALGDPVLRLLDEDDIAALLPGPGYDDHKYSRGVVGVLAGSAAYPGAAILAAGGARMGGAGMVQVLDRGDGVARGVIDHYPDVVATPVLDPRVSAWVVGPGMGTGPADHRALLEVLATDAAVVVDADALRMLDDEARAAIRARAPMRTVLTPHEGEFERMGCTVGEDRRRSVIGAALDLGAVVLLKGPGTIVADSQGAAYADIHGTSALATAGSGDVLAGLLAGMLAVVVARDDDADIARVTAAAVGLHGMAGEDAGADGRPVTAPDIAAALPTTIARIRS